MKQLIHNTINRAVSSAKMRAGRGRVSDLIKTLEKDKRNFPDDAKMLSIFINQSKQTDSDIVSHNGDYYVRAGDNYMTLLASGDMQLMCGTYYYETRLSAPMQVVADKHMQRMINRRKHAILAGISQRKSESLEHVMEQIKG